MKFDELDQQMRVFETAHDYCVLPGIYMFPLECELFKRKLRKLNSVLAGYASARFSLRLGAIAGFDCRICQLPASRHVVDYFRWRNEDAHRNALNAHCYWLLRKNGQSADAASSALLGMSVAAKNELLFQHGINFNDLPNWQKRGAGLYWQAVEKAGFNPLTNQKVVAWRRQIKRDLDLPMKDAYGEFIGTFIRDDVEAPIGRVVASDTKVIADARLNLE
jgi:tRNA(His) 5'-end guanylyltransferase